MLVLHDTNTSPCHAESMRANHQHNLTHQDRRISRIARRVLLAVAVFAFVLHGGLTHSGSQAMAQPAAKAKSKEDPKLKPRWETMKTKDGISIRAFYAPSAKGKDAIPVMIIHEWQGQGSPYEPLVNALRAAGCAVIVPEYRGHGTSRSYTDNTGQTKEFNISTMNKGDIDNIIAYDFEEVKQFLKKENNAGNLNLNALTLIGIREGAIMSMHWAVRDWSFPSVGRLKQGQDVKCLVLVSPEKNHKGLAIDPTLRSAAITQLPTMIVAGEESPESSEAKRIGKQIESVKKRLSRGEAKGFRLDMVPTSLSGAGLIREAPPVVPLIVKFIVANVTISDDSNPWVDRQ